jgi:iron-sulfur cluster assembly protein
MSSTPESLAMNPQVSEEHEPKKAESKLGLTITAAAAKAARAQLDKRGSAEAMIRLGIRGGGCSGFSYVIEFEDKAPRERDRVFEQDGVRFVVDKKSLLYLAGTVLDWEKTLMQQGFKFRNPNEKSSCGCGHSFQV